MANIRISGGNGSHGGGGASRGGTTEIIPVDTGRFVTPITNQNFVDYANQAKASVSSTPTLSTTMQNYYASQSAAADAAGAAYQKWADEQAVKASTPAPQTSTTTTSSSGGGSYSAPVVETSDPYDEMKAYMDRMYEEQRRQQEAAYQNTLSQLASSYNRGTENVNQSSDDALRQAYINYMMGKRNINQSLANNGITGGATESILSQLFNNYGTNRANIDKQRVNELADLAARYNQSVAEAGNNYGGDYTDLLNNYYASLVDLEKDRQDRIDRTINNATNLAYRTTNTANSGAADDVLASLINGTNRNTNLNDEYEDETTAGGNTYEANITQAQRDAIVNRLRQIYGTSANYDEDTRMNYVARTMQDLAAQYGLTDAQARAILADAEKGFH